jgi:DNA polymerase-3 subunit gamma/tau
VAIRSLAESAAQVRLQTVLSEHFGTVVKLRIHVGATGDDTAHAVAQARKAALQQHAEQAAQSDPFVQALLDQFDGRIVPGSIRPAADQKAA